MRLIKQFLRERAIRQASTHAADVKQTSTLNYEENLPWHVQSGYFLLTKTKPYIG